MNDSPVTPRARTKPSSHLPPNTSPPTAAEFDTLFRADISLPGFGRISRLVDPTLPPEIEPFSFLSTDLLHTIVGTLPIDMGEVLLDLGCGRGGPGLWLARELNARLFGLDISPVAVANANRRTAAFGLTGRASFLVTDLAATGLADTSVDAIIAIDTLQYAPHAISETRRILRPGGQLVLTGWHPNPHGDRRLPARHRHTHWPTLLTAAGFGHVTCVAHPSWTAAYQRTYTVALAQGHAHNDIALAALQGEAHRRLPTAHLLNRVLVTAKAPGSRR